MRKTVNYSLLLFCAAQVCTASAMQALEEQDMSAATAQDGINMGLYFPNGNIAYDSIAVTDKDGIAGSTTHQQAASIVIASDLNASQRGVSLQQANGVASTAPIQVAVDADGNAGEALANINIAMPTDAPLIHINPMAVYLAAGSDSIYQNGSIQPNATKILSIGNKGVDILFKSDETLGFNIQLGHASQGHMFQVSSGSLMCIANNAMCISGGDDDGSDPIKLYDKNGSSIQLGFKLSASNTATGVRLYQHGNFSGVYGDIVNSGVVFGADGTMDKFDVTLSNITLGQAGAQDPSTMNNLKNGSIGNIGMKGIAITDFKTTVKGL
ncbi:hypothetical protein SAMN05421749_103210 [Acinetobacter marinus]|uniref:Pilus assembly protein FilA n=1 Tax=Acinetobacter marinus TaxID=281375 RepID=A0A1G6J1N4_9GAMM|nr:hypothetical protein [Acinetobacter marinus]SDC12641.1 hypothetical protein SAMN05421749_103210 [Acinetobacter marinus]